MSTSGNSIAGKTFLVTGAGKGLGRALTIEIHKRGAGVIALSRTQEDLDQLLKICPGITAICADLSDWTTTREILESAIQEPVDVLINNAAVVFPETFLNISESNLQSTIDTNFKAVINVTQIFLNKLLASGKPGCVINVSSVGAKRPQPHVPVYCALKSALDSLTKSIAIEFGPKKIRAVSMILGIMDTTMTALGLPTAEHLRRYRSSIANSLLLGELFLPLEQAVECILFVCSGAVGMMTGCEVVLDGGFTTP